MPAICALLALLWLPLPAAGEIYRWTDDQGRMHFTEDLGKVPARHRGAARDAATAPPTPSGYSRVRSADPGVAPPASQGTAGAATRSGVRSYRIPVQRAGTGMRVQVKLNNSVTAPFLIDTGASDVVIPQTVAQELGIRIGPSTRTMVYSTANGVIEQPVVMLRSVEVGGARVNDVPASVSGSMSVGLLGLSFFNHFTYQIDAAAGVVTLTPNDLVDTGAIRGGRSEAQWRSAYGNLRARMGAVEAERARTPSSRGRKLRDLDAAEQALAKQLASLETEADSARVPMAWRE